MCLYESPKTLGSANNNNVIKKHSTIGTIKHLLCNRIETYHSIQVERDAIRAHRRHHHQISQINSPTRIEVQSPNHSIPQGQIKYLSPTPPPSPALRKS